MRREKTQNGTADDAIEADINALNSFMADTNKAACDSILGKWMLVAGTSYKMALPNQTWQKDGDEPPFNVYAPDPRRTFIVYSSDVDECPPMNVAYSKQKNGAVVFTIYTPASVFKYKYGHSDASVEVNPLWIIPYRGGPCCGLSGYLCIFEPVVPLVDALNALQSNRLDDVAQYINSFLAILGAQVDEEAYKKLDEWKMPCLPEGTDAKYLSSPMSQADVQTLKDDLYQAILTICGVPNRNGGYEHFRNWSGGGVARWLVLSRNESQGYQNLFQGLRMGASENSATYHAGCSAFQRKSSRSYWYSKPPEYR